MNKNSVAIAFIVVLCCVSMECRANQMEGSMETVTSKDGTKIVFEKTGSGPALILIGGALSSRSGARKHAESLSNDFTVYVFDRRGRGDSGDTKPYSVAKEIEDVDAIIDKAGGSVYLFGISSGACLALEVTAALGDKIKKLAIYEPPYDEAEGSAERWKEYKAEVERLVHAGSNAEAVEYHMKFVGVPAEVMAGIKASPAWSEMKKLAPTILYDIAVVGNNRSIPVERVRKIKAPTLVMDGGASLETMPFMRATADKLSKTISNAQRRTMEGEAHNVSEKSLAPVLKEFFGKR